MQPLPLLNNIGNLGSWNYYFPSFQHNQIYPEVIGEGDIISLSLPDGKTQFYFVPVPKQYATNINNPYFSTGVGAWFIRSFPEQIFPHWATHLALGGQAQYSHPNYGFDTNPNTGNAYTIKFHSNGWTSTTDLHYFCKPQLRHLNWYSNLNAAVQVDLPLETNICHYQVLCNKPCHCAKNDCNKQESPMSVDEENKKKPDNCECGNFNKSDKSITTFEDQGCGSSKTTRKKKAFRKKESDSSFECSCCD